MEKPSQEGSAWRRRIAPAPQDVRAALAVLPEGDLLRLRALSGARPWPPGVPLVAFLAQVMRSLCDEQWRRHHRETVLRHPSPAASVDDPERAYAASEALAVLHRLFASDEAALKVITGLIGGMEAEEIRRHYGLTAIEYNSTRRRMRRAILSHGLA